MDINIKVKDKIAVGDETLIVCGNSDYTVNFELDAEWAAYDKKTMRIGYRNGKYKEEQDEAAKHICNMTGGKRNG